MSFTSVEFRHYLLGQTEGVIILLTMFTSNLESGVWWQNTPNICLNTPISYTLQARETLRTLMKKEDIYPLVEILIVDTDTLY